MRFRPTLAQIANMLMIVVLCIAAGKLLARGDNKNSLLMYKSGDHIARSIWHTMPDARRTVVLVDRSGCHFCTESMPFYVEMVRDANAAGAEVVSVTPEDSNANRRYLDSYHLHVERIIQLKDTPLKVAATPTLIVLDEHKTVLGAWVGELGSGEQEKVLHLVRTGSV